MADNPRRGPFAAFPPFRGLVIPSPQPSEVLNPSIDPGLGAAPPGDVALGALVSPNVSGQSPMEVWGRAEIEKANARRAMEGLAPPRVFWRRTSGSIGGNGTFLMTIDFVPEWWVVKVHPSAQVAAFDVDQADEVDHIYASTSELRKEIYKGNYQSIKVNNLAGASTLYVQITALIGYNPLWV